MEYTASTGESKVHIVQYAGHRIYLQGKEISPYLLPVIERRYLGIRTDVSVAANSELVVEKICCVYTSRVKEAN